MKTFGSWRERYLLERNALLCLYKNLEDATLSRALAPALALAVRRTIALGGDDPTVLDLQRSPGSDDSDRLDISKTTMTGPYAVDYLVEQLPSLDLTRRELQHRRRRTDRELFPLFRRPMEPANSNRRYRVGYDALVAAFDIAEVYSAALQPVPVGHASVGADHDVAGLLEDYRASAAQRAERITELLHAVDAAKARETATRARLAKSQAKNVQLQARITQLQGKAARLQKRVGRLEKSGAPAPPRAPGGALHRPRRLVKRLARRLGVAEHLTHRSRRPA